MNTRTDTLIVGPIEDGAYFSMSASTNTKFGMFYNLLNSLIFKQTPIGPSYYDILYFTARKISSSLSGNQRNITLILSVYSKPKQSQFLGYLKWDSTGISIQQTQSQITIFTTDPSSYQYTSILTSVRYSVMNAVVTISNCIKPEKFFCVESSLQTYNASSLYILFIPYIRYKSPNCYQISYNQYNYSASSVALSQCYYYDQLSEICSQALLEANFSTQKDCQQYSSFGKYFYTYNQCGQSYSFYDLLDRQTSVSTGIGICDDSNECKLFESNFSCPQTVPDNPKNNDDQQEQQNTNLMKWLVVIIISFVLVIAVVIILLASRN